MLTSMFRKNRSKLRSKSLRCLFLWIRDWPLQSQRSGHQQMISVQLFRTRRFGLFLMLPCVDYMGVNSFPHCVQLKKALEDLTELLAEKEGLAQRCQELDMQVHSIHTSFSFFISEKYTMVCFCYSYVASVPVKVQTMSIRTHTHTQWCSINRCCVIRCNAWVYCLELLWQKDCGLTVWALLWQPASALPLKKGLTEHCAG